MQIGGEGREAASDEGAATSTACLAGAAALFLEIGSVLEAWEEVGA